MLLLYARRCGVCAYEGDSDSGRICAHCRMRSASGNQKDQGHRRRALCAAGLLQLHTHAEGNSGDREGDRHHQRHPPGPISGGIGGRGD